MTFTTYKSAKDSLREFTPWMRAKHKIVRIWSAKDEAYRYCRVFTA